MKPQINTITMNSTLSKLIVISSAYLMPINTFIYFIIALVTIDFITGIWSAVKQAGIWKPVRIWFTQKFIKLPIAGIKSRTMKRSVIKMIAYLLAIGVSYGFERTILGTGIIVTQFVTGLISLVEIASIFENLAKITDNNVFTKIFDCLSTYFNKNKNIISKIDGINEDSDKPADNQPPVDLGNPMDK